MYIEGSLLSKNLFFIWSNSAILVYECARHNHDHTQAQRSKQTWRDEVLHQFFSFRFWLLIETKVKLIKAGCDMNRTTHHNHFDNFSLSPSPEVLVKASPGWSVVASQQCKLIKASCDMTSSTHHTNFDDLHYYCSNPASCCAVFC